MAETVENLFPIIEKIAKEKLSWEFVAKDDKNKKLQYIATTQIFKFKDDIVIQIEKKNETTSIIQIRSKSRIGKSVNII